jgi:hypothetical protein
LEAAGLLSDTTYLTPAAVCAADGHAEGDAGIQIHAVVARVLLHERLARGQRLERVVEHGEVGLVVELDNVGGVVLVPPRRRARAGDRHEEERGTRGVGGRDGVRAGVEEVGDGDWR